jgi:class 3 adenylate cyclase
MRRFTAAATCPNCHATQVAPLVSAPAWWQPIWKRLTGHWASQTWFCRHCGQRWDGPPASDLPGLEEMGGAVKLMTLSCASVHGGLGEYPVWELVALLNGHFSLQVEAIRDHQGYFDKIMDMAVRAFWEAPSQGEDNSALRACQAALAQLRAMETLRTSFPGAPSLCLSIGISTGRVVACNLGPEGSRIYSVLGDSVNLCQRLQAANRLYGTSSLICEETCQKSGTAMVTREIDALRVKGRKDPVRIFELLGGNDEVPAARLLLRDKFSQALDAYRRQQWDQAETAWKTCLEISPSDGPSWFYLERIKSRSP